MNKKFVKKVYSELSIDLKIENGFNKLLDFLDHKLQNDGISDSWAKFNGFDEYSEEPSQSISDFTFTFDQKQMKLPPEILAFKLLKEVQCSNGPLVLRLTSHTSQK